MEYFDGMIYADEYERVTGAGLSLFRDIEEPGDDYVAAAKKAAEPEQPAQDIPAEYAALKAKYGDKISLRYMENNGGDYPFRLTLAHVVLNQMSKEFIFGAIIKIKPSDIVNDSDHCAPGDCRFRFGKLGFNERQALGGNGFTACDDAMEYKLLRAYIPIDFLISCLHSAKSIDLSACTLQSTKNKPHDTSIDPPVSQVPKAIGIVNALALANM